MMKEILKNEILKEEELEQIAGGNRDELALDTQLLNTMGNRMEPYTLYQLTDANVRGISARVTSMFGQFGIKVEYNDTGASKYSIDGNPIPRNQAVTELLYRAGYHDIDPTPFQIRR